MPDIPKHTSAPGDPRWSYDDPSGVPETPLAVRVPETLRGGVERAAAREGLSPGEWLITLVTKGVLSGPTTPKAA
ncbi:MAG: hypothetical protein JWM06_2400 [Actinomycetia bacterium]|nr:hypothetical protein [Actinomycetes bacterium]